MKLLIKSVLAFEVSKKSNQWIARSPCISTCVEINNAEGIKIIAVDIWMKDHIKVITDYTVIWSILQGNILLFFCKKKGYLCLVYTILQE